MESCRGTIGTIILTAILLFVSWLTRRLPQNLNLASHLDSGDLSIIEAMPSVLSALGSSENVPLRRLYDQIDETLSPPSSGPERSVLVIFDDVSSLEWMGVSVDSISRFVRAVCSLCQRVRSCLVRPLIH